MKGLSLCVEELGNDIASKKGSKSRQLRLSNQERQEKIFCYKGVLTKRLEVLGEEVNRN
jgi:hypothetical protein